MENNNISEQDYFPIWLAIDNGKILLCSTNEKYCTDFAKIYEFAHGYEIELISIYCYK